MRIRKEILSRNAADNLISYFPDGDPVFFDIETTGLSWKSSDLYMIGVLSRENGSWTVTQFFMNNPGEELQMLQAFNALLKNHSESIVHFNGDMFDIPYIRHKCGKYGIGDPFMDFSSLDIYKKIRPYQRLLCMPDMRQKTLEKFLGIGRDDTMSGGELIGVYKRFLVSKDRHLEDLLFLHNHDDVLGLLEILPALSVPSLFESINQAELYGSFESMSPAETTVPFENMNPAETDSSGCGVPDGKAKVCDPYIKARIQNSGKLIIKIALRHRLPEKILSDILPLNDPLVTLSPYPDAELFLSSYQGQMPSDHGLISSGSYEPQDDVLFLIVPVIRTTLRHFFQDYRNYWYLPAEDEAVHKDVAVFVDRERREKATRENCYQNVTGDFIPDPDGKLKPSFSSRYDSKLSWCMPDNQQLSEPYGLAEYAHGMLRVFI